MDTLANGDLPTAPQSAPGVAIPRRVTVTSLNYRDQFLPIYDGTSSLAGLGSGWFYDAALESVHRADPVKPDPYEISLSTVRRGADQLRADTVTAGGTLTDTGTLSDEVVALTAAGDGRRHHRVRQGGSAYAPGSPTPPTASPIRSTSRAVTAATRWSTS